jgi:hypothetical protein
MRNFLSNRRVGSLTTLIFVIVLGFSLPHSAYAFLGIDAADIGNIVLWLPGMVIGKIVMPVVSWFVYITGMLLNWSVQYSVINMKTNYASANIESVWTVVRDLANMGFIFVLLYTSIMTIFGEDKWKETIKNIVIAALLINFSLLITRAVIDASNVLALLFYDAISPNAKDITYGISASFMNVLGIQSLYNATSGLEGAKMVIIGVSGVIIYLITALSFLAAALMFVIRFVVLLFVLALSPIMFVGMIFPNAGDFRKQWMNTLIGQSFFAPVYFMLTWIVLKVAQGLFHTTSGSLSGAVLGKAGAGGASVLDASAIEILMKFVIMIGLMIGSLIAAKKFADKSAVGGTKFAMSVAGGAVLGTAGKIGRGTIGRASSAIAQSESVKKAIEKGGAAGMAGRLAMYAGNKGAKSSFDLRAAPVGIGAKLGELGAGKVKKGTSFEGDVKERIRKATETANALKPTDAVLDPAKKKKEAAEEVYDQKLRDAGYSVPPELATAREAFKASKKREPNETQEMWDLRKEEAKKALDEAEASEKANREAFVASHSDPTLASAKAEYDTAAETLKEMETRADRYVTKQSEPTFNLPKIPERWAAGNAVLEGDNRAIDTFNKKGLGGGIAASPLATATKEVLDRTSERISSYTKTSDKIIAAPTGWLASLAKAGIASVGLRQQERDARVEAVRKARKKKKNEVAEAVKELKKDDGGGDGDKKQ